MTEAQTPFQQFTDSDGAYLKLTVDDHGVLRAQLSVKFSPDSDRDHCNALVLLGHGLIAALTLDQAGFIDMGVDYLASLQGAVQSPVEDAEELEEVADNPRTRVTHLPPKGSVQ